MVRVWHEEDHLRDAWGKFAEMADTDTWAHRVSERIGAAKAHESAGYRPGAWRQQTLAEQVATLAKDMYDGALEVQPGYDRDELRRLCMEFADQQIPAGRRQDTVLVNGRSVIRSDDPRVGRAELEDVAAMVDDLYTRFPAAGRMNINVVGDGFPMSDPDASGQTVHGEAFMHIRASAWSQTRTSADGFMPAQDDHSRWTYVLAHEWGHAIDHSSPLDQLMAQFEEGVYGLSTYGESSPREGFAEAFAEWYLTRGHTANRAARFYAQKFGWGEPW